jgi:membrane-bound ClpP family serine protease
MDDLNLLHALAFLGGAVALLVAEFFIVSMGLLAVLAIACAGLAIYVAFGVSTGAGWLFAIGTPVLLTIITKYGITRLQHSRVVPQSEITADAGYHHATDRLGIAVGSEGIMVTPAMPTGRARFTGGECDVQSRDGPLDLQNKVRVVLIDGPIVYVELADSSPTTN